MGLRCRGLYGGENLVTVRSIFAIEGNMEERACQSACSTGTTAFITHQ